MYHQEDEFIDPTIFVATVGLGDRINKLVFSNFMGMVSTVLVIFDTVYTYLCYTNKGEFVKTEWKMFPINIEGIEKGLDIYGFWIFEYSVSSESGRMIALQSQAYYVPRLPKDLRIIYPRGICTSEEYKVTFIVHCHDENYSYVELTLK